MKRRITVIGSLLLISLCGYFGLRGNVTPMAELEPFIVKEERSYGRIESFHFGAKKGTVENYVIREATVRGLTTKQLEESLLDAFSKEDGWTWSFVKDKGGRLQMARASQDKDEVTVTEIANSECVVRYQKLADTRDILWARAQNWGKDPFLQAPIEMRLGYAIAID